MTQTGTRRRLQASRETRTVRFVLIEVNECVLILLGAEGDVQGFNNSVDQSYDQGEQQGRH